MRGHVTKRGRNSWTIVLYLGRDPATGKKKYKWVSVKGVKKEAERRLAELIHQLDTGGYAEPSKDTVGGFLLHWLNDLASLNLAPRTVEGYEHIVHQHLIPALGVIPLAQLHPERIQQYHSEKLAAGRRDGKGGLSPKTVRHHHAVLHDALQAALKRGLVARNAADAVTPPRVTVREAHTFDQDGLQTFLQAARSTPYHALFYTLLFTGARRSEMLALRWKDVDLDMGEITIARSLHHLRNGKTDIRPPKSAKGRRSIPLPASATIVLRRHKDGQAAERLPLGGHAPSPDDFVFAQSDGTPWLPDTVSAGWRKLARKSGFVGIRLHDARHTHATLMLKAGIHPKIVQERLGHASIQITLDTYSHVSPNLQRSAAERFDADVGSPEQEAGLVEPAELLLGPD